MPNFYIILLIGMCKECAEIISNHLLPHFFKIFTMLYEIYLIDKFTFKKLLTKSIISRMLTPLSQIVQSFISHGHLFITSTCLQNSLKELFILPVWRFLPNTQTWVVSCMMMSTMRKREEEEEEEDENSKKVTGALHKVLWPFLLRWVKSDIEKNLSPKKETNIYISLKEMCRKWYCLVLEKDIGVVNGKCLLCGLADK